MSCTCMVVSINSEHGSSKMLPMFFELIAVLAVAVCAVHGLSTSTVTYSLYSEPDQYCYQMLSMVTIKTYVLVFNQQNLVLTLY